MLTHMPPQLLHNTLEISHLPHVTTHVTTLAPLPSVSHINTCDKERTDISKQNGQLSPELLHVLQLVATEGSCYEAES